MYLDPLLLLRISVHFKTVWVGIWPGGSGIHVPAPAPGSSFLPMQLLAWVLGFLACSFGPSPAPAIAGSWAIGIGMTTPHPHLPTPAKSQINKTSNNVGNKTQNPIWLCKQHLGLGPEPTLTSSSPLSPSSAIPGLFSAAVLSSFTEHHGSSVVEQVTFGVWLLWVSKQPPCCCMQHSFIPGLVRSGHLLYASTGLN